MANKGNEQMLKINTKSFLILFMGAAIFTLAIIIFAQPYRMYGNCMEPAKQDGGLYFLNNATRYLGSHQYRVGDIILFKHENRVWVSRVVGLENDMIEIKENIISVNDNVLEDNIERNWTDWKFGTYAIDNIFQVPQGHVYVLSDNLSAHHDDSRVFGAISNTAIVGRLW